MSKFDLCAKKYYEMIKKIFPLNDRLEKEYNKCINMLIDRYNIKNKIIMSIGPGIGNEEYYFSINNELILIDIDEHNSLKKLLNDNYENLKWNIGDNKLVFIIDDINNQLISTNNNNNILINNKVDLIYISSLTIDVVGKNDRYYNDGELFIPIYNNLINDYLVENGLFIQQLYGSSIIPPLDIIVKKLEELNVTVLDIYQFKNALSIMLLVTIKTNKENAKNMYNDYKGIITNFHGRAFMEYNEQERIEETKIIHSYSII